MLSGYPDNIQDFQCGDMVATWLWMERRLFHCLFGLLALLILWLAVAPVARIYMQDFPQLYYAGRFVNEGRIQQIYDHSAYGAYLAEFTAAQPRERLYCIYWNRPPWQAPLFAPLARLPLLTAWRVWEGFNLLMAGIIWVLLFRRYPLNPVLFFGLLLFFPLVYGFTLNQDTLVLALLVILGLQVAEQGRDGLAGALFGLATFKPHLVFLLPFAMLATRRYRMLGSYSAVAVPLWLFGAWLVGVHGLQQWWLDLQLPTTDIHPETMLTFRALFLNFGASLGVLLTVLTLAAAGLVWIYRRSWPEVSTVALLLSLLASPHTYQQDLAVLLIPLLTLFPRWLQYAYLLPWIWILPQYGPQLYLFLMIASVFYLGWQQRHCLSWRLPAVARDGERAPS